MAEGLSARKLGRDPDKYLGFPPRTKQNYVVDFSSPILALKLSSIMRIQTLFAILLLGVELGAAAGGRSKAMIQFEEYHSSDNSLVKRDDPDDKCDKENPVHGSGIAKRRTWEFSLGSLKEWGTYGFL